MDHERQTDTVRVVAAILELRRVLRVGAAAAFVLFFAQVAQAQASPVGEWHTVSDVEGSPAALIEIREAEGALVGTVKAILPPGENQDELCDRCTGERRGRRIVGLQLLWEMRQDGDEWSGGSILDPESGKIYRATMHLEEKGTRLVVRGFIGIPLFGRSQTWLRVK